MQREDEPCFPGLRRRHHRHGDAPHREPANRRPIAAAEDTVSVSVVCPDRWFPGDFAVVTSRDGHAFAGEVDSMDVCTGEATIRGTGG